MTPLKHKLVIAKGKTLREVIRWEVEPYLYVPITGIAPEGPARITVPAHGIPNGWRVAPVSIEGMVELNAIGNPPLDEDFTRARVITSDLIELNEINVSSFTPYVSGGFLQMFSPADLTGFSARMQIKDRAGVELLLLTSENGGIVIDNAAKTITLVASAAQTAAFAFRAGLYDLEMVSPLGVVTTLIFGSVSVTSEVTTA